MSGVPCRAAIMTYLSNIQRTQGYFLGAYRDDSIPEKRLWLPTKITRTGWGGKGMNLSCLFQGGGLQGTEVPI